MVSFTTDFGTARPVPGESSRRGVWTDNSSLSVELSPLILWVWLDKGGTGGQDKQSLT